jgi:hypothetical protein
VTGRICHLAVRISAAAALLVVVAVVIIIMVIVVVIVPVVIVIVTVVVVTVVVLVVVVVTAIIIIIIVIVVVVVAAVVVWNRDSVVDTATITDSTVRGSNSGGGEIFSHPSRPSPRPTQPPVQWVPFFLPRGKAAGAWR